MTISIKDGTGTGNQASVDTLGRIGVEGETNGSFINSALTGNGYFTTTRSVTLTSDTESCLLYIQNTSERDLVIVNSRHYIGASDASGSVLPSYNIDPTGGTILTGTNGVDYNTGAGVNLNFGEQLSKPFTGVIRVGLEGTSVTSALPSVQVLVPQNDIFINRFSVSLPRGSAVSASITPPSGNTSMTVIIDFLMYYKT